jgi:putative endonuclease
MARHIELGKEGEDLAKAFLIKNEYQILETNWRYKRAEIDIIAKKEEVLVFVEVKTRSSDSYGQPADFVNLKKMQFLSEAAPIYMEKIGHEWEIRFDIIGILKTPEGTKTSHLKDVYFPEW